MCGTLQSCQRTFQDKVVRWGPNVDLTCSQVLTQHLEDDFPWPLRSSEGSSLNYEPVQRHLIWANAAAHGRMFWLRFFHQASERHEAFGESCRCLETSVNHLKTASKWFWVQFIQNKAVKFLHFGLSQMHKVTKKFKNCWSLSWFLFLFSLTVLCCVSKGNII